MPNTAPLPPEPTLVPEPDGPLNILLLGTDARIGQDISRTDAIILVHLDPREDRASMLSLPRDLWVQIPGYGKDRINAAYPIGERQIGPGYGPALAKATVSKLTGVRAQRIHLGLADATGRQAPQAIEGSHFNLPADLVLKALGFDPEDIPVRFQAPEVENGRFKVPRILGEAP